MRIQIAPSILSADFTKIGEEIKRIEKAGADIVHCDVMDGMYVPNITFGGKMIEDIKKITSMPLDTHLMIKEPERYIDYFASCGSDIITIHVEACNCVLKTLEHIKALGKKCGVVIDAYTDAEKCFEYLELCDMVLVMSVKAGFGGQKFMTESIGKIKMISDERTRRNLSFDIEVDGGITAENVGVVAAVGANVIVAGSAIFLSCDAKKTIADIRRNAEEVFI